jgi:sigma-E factor negative regulatory protein RseC
VEALNTVGARVGDRIQMTIKTGSLLKATFLLYIFPILCMLGGAVLGNGLAMGLGLNPSAMAALGALASFAAAMVIVRARGRRMGSDRAYRPEIIRVLGRAPRDTADTAPVVECPGTDENHKAPTGNGRHD